MIRVPFCVCPGGGGCFWDWRVGEGSAWSRRWLDPSKATGAKQASVSSGMLMPSGFVGLLRSVPGHGSLGDQAQEYKTICRSNLSGVASVEKECRESERERMLAFFLWHSCGVIRPCLAGAGAHETSAFFLRIFRARNFVARPHRRKLRARRSERLAAIDRFYLEDSRSHPERDRSGLSLQWRVVLEIGFCACFTRIQGKPNRGDSASRRRSRWIAIIGCEWGGWAGGGRRRHDGVGDEE